MTYGTGPRIISSTMGQTVAQTVKDLGGNSITFNNTRVSDANDATDGTPVADGFLVTFDRPIDPTTFTRDDITVTYRDPSTPGSSPGIPIPLTVDPVAVIDPKNPLSVAGNTFLVRFPGQSFVGTYSYTVGPNIRDLSRNTLATNFYYANQTTTNLPSVPPTGTGGSGIPANDDAKSVVTVQNVPANQNILDLAVMVSIQHTSDSDLVLKLIPPPGFLPNQANGQPGFILLAQNRGTGADYTSTTFDEQGTAQDSKTASILHSITSRASQSPFTGTFSTELYNPFFTTGASAGLHQLNGKNPNGTWTLEIDDTAAGNSGKLLSWGLKITTSNRSADGKFTQAGAPALSPSVGSNAVLSGGQLMDQNADGVGGQNPNASGQGSPPARRSSASPPATSTPCPRPPPPRPNSSTARTSTRRSTRPPCRS